MDTDTLRQQEALRDAPARAAGPRLRLDMRRIFRALRLGGIALLVGLLGSLTAMLVMGALRLTVGTPTLPELLGDRILPTLSASKFVDLLVQFAPNSKTTPLGLTLLGQGIVGIVLGPLFCLAAGKALLVRGFWPGRRAWIAAGAFALAMEGVGLALFWPVIGQGLVGDPVDRARLLTALSMLATFASCMLMMLLAGHGLYRAWAAQPEPPPLLVSPLSPVAGEPAPDAAPTESPSGISRRTALQTAGVMVVAVAAGGLGINRLIAGYLARSNLSYEGMPNFSLEPVTPIEDFYVVSQNVLDPQVDLTRWQLEIRGLVRQPQAWSYAEMLALPSETRAVTLECISNGVGHKLMSTAIWKGVLLETALNTAGGAQPNGKYVIYTSVDGYQYSLPLADLLEARALLAWEMNGVPLPERHGFPLRAVTPGRYGEQSNKWLTRVEVVDQPYNGGLYQSQGWSSAQVATTSRIDTPAGQAKAGSVTVAGLAYAGIRGIQQVEVSADDGLTWHAATLLPPLSDQSWVFWTWAWTPPGKGTYTLVVRATDGTGALQTEMQRGTVPNGATGWQHVTLHIV
ncbi:MAG TPA: molybdopterin-dependent oxidoreductase [Ktedonobacterales bacterium]|jgi:DMSO/TMAO reductase YedYZ molybdopterin-dependent catalytic subunit